MTKCSKKNSSHLHSARSEVINRLASDIDAFAYDYDTYEYQDCVVDREANVAEIAKSILTGEALGSRVYLFGIVCDGDATDPMTKKAICLLNRLYTVLNMDERMVASL